MRILTGLQPSGKIHLGNYFASIKSMLEAQNSNDEMFIFIANYHAMTSGNCGENLKTNSFEMACSLLAFGIDPNISTFWLQSDVKEVLELYWFLSFYTPVGLLERSHAYKDKVAKGIEANHALFSYPVLMAADILLFNANLIPVGKDQTQHIEIARDIALKFNNVNGEIFTLPKAKIDENLSLIPGIDGAKMSKSYKNTIDIFSSQKDLKKQIGKIVTNSTPLEDPKCWETCNIFALAKLFLNDDEIKNLKARYEKGGEGYGHFKVYLNELILNYFKLEREKFEYFLNHKSEVLEILDFGAKKAKKIAQQNLEKIYNAVGI